MRYYPTRNRNRIIMRECRSFPASFACLVDSSYMECLWVAGINDSQILHADVLKLIHHRICFKQVQMIKAGKANTANETP